MEIALLKVGGEKIKNKTTFLVSIGVVAILLILSINPSIGYAVVKNRKKADIVPLFEMQLNRAVKDSDCLNMQTSFVGKNKKVTVVIPGLQDLPDWLDMIVEKIREKPELLDQALAKIFSNHRLANALEKVGIGRVKILSIVNRLKDNPTLLKEEITRAAIVNPDIGLFLKKIDFSPQQTSNIACIISALIGMIFIPVIIALLIVVMVLTLTIITCIVNSELLQMIEEFMNIFTSCTIP